jgi:purine-nucleoside phosphorylase
MLRSLGADGVGMSTVCETIRDCALGLEVARFRVTNWAAGLNRTPLSHAEVLAAGETIAAEFISLPGAALPPAAGASRNG